MIKIFTLLLLCWGLPASALQAQDSESPLELSPKAATTDEPLDTKVSLEPSAPAKGETAAPFGDPQAASIPDDLSAEQKEEFVELMKEAATFVQGIRIQEALDRINRAEAIYPDHHALHNLKGAAYTKIRDFENATKSFQRCLELNPGSLEARFNLAEMDFVEKRYEKALAAFEGLLKDNPRFPASTRNLILYKQYLCHLMSEQDEAAEKLLASFNYMSDTPEFYFSNAAKSFHADDKLEARTWLKSASRIYSKSLQDLYVDSLVEIGWIETL